MVAAQPIGHDGATGGILGISDRQCRHLDIEACDRRQIGLHSAGRAHVIDNRHTIVSRIKSFGGRRVEYGQNRKCCGFKAIHGGPDRLETAFPVGVDDGLALLLGDVHLRSTTFQGVVNGLGKGIIELTFARCGQGIGARWRIGCHGGQVRQRQRQAGSLDPEMSIRLIGVKFDGVGIDRCAGRARDFLQIVVVVEPA